MVNGFNTETVEIEVLMVHPCFPATGTTRLSPVNMALPAFAADRLTPAIGRYHLFVRSAANPPNDAAALDRWDERTNRRMDRGTLDRYKNPAPPTMSAVSIGPK